MIYTIPLDESQYARKKRQTQTSYYVSGASSLDAIAIYNSTSAQTQQRKFFSTSTTVCTVTLSYSSLIVLYETSLLLKYSPDE